MFEYNIIGVVLSTDHLAVRAQSKSVVDLAVPLPPKYTPLYKDSYQP